MTMRNDLLASDFLTIVPSDTTQLNLVGLYVGGTGDVAVKGEGGTAVTFKACPIGHKIEGRIINVMSTNTTATLLIGFLP